MSMISRYKKKGGFLQLLNLIETSGREKQEKFLKLVEEEDARWSEAIRTKMLSIKKIFAWDDNTVAEIVGRLNDLTVATALHGLDAAAKEKTFKMIGASRKRKIEEIMAEKQPTPAELSTIFMQILTEVRSQIAQGYIYLDKIDSQLVVEQDIEERLSQATLFTMGTDTKATSSDLAATTVSAEVPKHNAKDSGDVEALKRRLSQLMTENTHLKEKLIQAEGRLAQIRKFAA